MLPPVEKGLRVSWEGEVSFMGGEAGRVLIRKKASVVLGRERVAAENGEDLRWEGWEANFYKGRKERLRRGHVGYKKKG